MKYVTPPGQAAGSSYIDLDAATKTIGSPVIAAAIENPMREWEALIKGAGLTPDEKNLAQGLEAVQKIAQSLVKAIGTLTAKSPLAVSNGGDLTGTVELTVAAASETVAGVSERATDAEASGGTDAVRHVTPKHLKTGLDQKAAASHGHAVGDLTGALPIANGGTGATTAAAARNALGLGNTAAALPVANGGTGATTAAAALTNLGAAASSHGHAVGDLTGALPIANGGTGATTAAAARNALGLGNTTAALPVANGGTGATTAAAARNALGLGNTTAALPIANGGTGATTAALALTNLGAAPLPQAAAGIGQWILVTKSGSPPSLPAGGTWAWFGLRSTGYTPANAIAGTSDTGAGVAAGGTVIVFNNTAGQSGQAYNYGIFCWRIA